MRLTATYRSAPSWASASFGLVSHGSSVSSVGWFILYCVHHHMEDMGWWQGTAGLSRTKEGQGGISTTECSITTLD